MELNERIFYLLEKQGKSASSLASHLKIKPASLSGWKNEGSYPSSKYIVAISEFLNVSPTYLLCGYDTALPEHILNLINAYQKTDEGTRKAINKLLDLN